MKLRNIYVINSRQLLKKHEENTKEEEVEKGNLLRSRRSSENMPPYKIEVLENFEEITVLQPFNLSVRLLDKNWHRRFREGWESVEDDKLSEHPQSSRAAENIEKVSTAVRRKKRLQTTVKIVESVEISSVTCQWISTKNLDMHSVCQHIVTRMLNENDFAD
ncbi:hypothetical protein TNCV_4442371 [Trichonephila clavipes]|nr:hypothetical protein TNCV_4442371 [Trichonephila clavipes]